MAKLRTIIIFFTAMIFYSCTSSQAVYNVTEITLEELMTKVNSNSAKLRALDAEGEVSIDSPEFSNTGSITVSLLKPDSIFVKLDGPFGISVAQILMTRNNFFYYNVMDNRVIRGPSSPLNLGAIMRINLDFDEIINGFSGTYTFRGVRYEDANITIDKDNYVLTLNNNFEIKKYWIDHKNFYIKKYGIYDMKGAAKQVIEYSDYEFRNNIHFPNKINISRPQERQHIWLTYYRKSFNSNKLNFRLRVAPSATYTTWD
jgi:outer membrane lipoprotein-sorting protein